MVDIEITPDCGNAPKQAQVRDLIVAAATGQRDAFEAAVEPGFVARHAGGTSVEGAKAVDSVIGMLGPDGLTGLRLDLVFSHGTFVAATGVLIRGDKAEEFCHLVTYGGHGKTARVASITMFGAP
ncbi:hypothetical protein [Demequina sp. NBRC 110055]|uniref:hypothetical protein n=1 Tax=Demequina sp. NBRC 110055 TaxID=1570344 RepID=UPI0011849B12|nr:hypothetical protein [Demequina sp. NBRC 110055]